MGFSDGVEERGFLRSQGRDSMVLKRECEAVDRAGLGLAHIIRRL